MATAPGPPRQGNGAALPLFIAYTSLDGGRPNAASGRGGFFAPY